jgi:hypothetical protein
MNRQHRATLSTAKISGGTSIVFRFRAKRENKIRRTCIRKGCMLWTLLFVVGSYCICANSWNCLTHEKHHEYRANRTDNRSANAALHHVRHLASILCFAPQHELTECQLAVFLQLIVHCERVLHVLVAAQPSASTDDATKEAQSNTKKIH